MAVRPGNREGKLRSVDSERTGRVIEPRNLCIVEADAFGWAEGSTDAPRGGEIATMLGNEAPATAKAAGNSDSPRASVVLNGQGAPGSTGVCEQGMSARVPQEPGRPRRLRRASDGTAERETIEAKRDGRRGVGAPHCTDEAGTAARATLWREGGAESRNRLEER